MPSRTTGLPAAMAHAVPLGDVAPLIARPNDVCISTASMQAIGDGVTGLAASTFVSATYPAASRVLAWPFEVGDYGFTIRRMFWMNGTTVGTDSADVGVYTEDGQTLLVSAGGGILIASATDLQITNVADTVLGPGRYWCAYVQSGVTATPFMCGANIWTSRAWGAAQQAGSGSTLGSTFTPAALVSANLPLCGMLGTP